MTELDVDRRRLKICDDCPGRNNNDKPDLILLGSTWDSDTDISNPPFVERREIATIDAHLAKFVIVNASDTPEDGQLIVDCVFDAINGCDAEKGQEAIADEFCPGVIEAVKLFYEKTRRGQE